MTRIDFYILAEQALDQQHRFACQLAEKALLRGHSVLLQVNNEAEAQQLDQLLWTFRANAFVPHELLPDANPEQPALVSIGWDTEGGHQHDVLINLASELPPFFARFQRLIEVVVQHDVVLDYTRKHYKFLKDRGYPIHNTDMRLR
ncbi:MAG: DNA polymerase III subunit chi [Bacterioplanes sp.]|nr:DNA polymerase III subunit chi [Bacterioplanes sp.]